MGEEPLWCVYMCVCMYMCVCKCVYLCVRAGMCMCVCVETVRAVSDQQDRVTQGRLATSAGIFAY